MQRGWSYARLGGAVACGRSWNEDIDIDASSQKMVHTTKQYKFEANPSPIPQAVKTEKLLDARLSPEQLQQLTSAVLSSGVMQLAASYGAPEGERYYSYELALTFAGQPTKTVTYRSNPAFDAEPEPFKKLVSYLRDLCLSLEQP